MRRSVFVCVALVLVGCGGGSSPTSPGPSSPPPASTFSLGGIVTESAPTTDVMVGGAVLRIVDGPDAGKTATANDSGAFTFTGLRQAGFTVEATANGYLPGSQGVNLTSNQTITLRLKPTPQVVTSTRNEVISGGDPSCLNGSSDPCKVYRIDAHHNGSVESTLTWDDRDTWLWLALYRASDGSQVVESSSSRVNGLRQHISTNVVEGQRYLLVVRYVFGARSTNFSLTTVRPN